MCGKERISPTEGAEENSIQINPRLIGVFGLRGSVYRWIMLAFKLRGFTPGVREREEASLIPTVGLWGK